MASRIWCFASFTIGDDCLEATGKNQKIIPISCAVATGYLSSCPHRQCMYLYGGSLR
jgi:hypothetical protein